MEGFLGQCMQEVSANCHCGVFVATYISFLLYESSKKLFVLISAPEVLLWIRIKNTIRQLNGEYKLKAQN